MNKENKFRRMSMTWVLGVALCLAAFSWTYQAAYAQDTPPAPPESVGAYEAPPQPQMPPPPPGPPEDMRGQDNPPAPPMAGAGPDLPTPPSCVRGADLALQAPVRYGQRFDRGGPAARGYAPGFGQRGRFGQAGGQRPGSRGGFQGARGQGPGPAYGWGRPKGQRGGMGAVPPEWAGRRQPPDIDAVFQQMDANGDGMVSRDEFRAFHDRRCPPCPRKGQWSDDRNSGPTRGAVPAVPPSPPMPGQVEGPVPPPAQS